MRDVNALSEQGIAHNNYKIAIGSMGVSIDINPHVSIKIPHKRFREFAKWYLEDQDGA